MRHIDTSPDPEWCVHSVFVPRRDGGQRVEAVIRAVLAPPPPEPPRAVLPKKVLLTILPLPEM